MLERNLRPSDILTKKSFENAIVVVNALGRAQGILWNPKDRSFGIALQNPFWASQCICQWQLGHANQVAPQMQSCIYLPLQQQRRLHAWNMWRLSLLNVSFREDSSLQVNRSESGKAQRGKSPRGHPPLLPRIAWMAKIELTIDDFQRISAKTALIADLKPSGKFRMEESWGTWDPHLNARMLDSYMLIKFSQVSTTSRMIL